jgi:hypothetical protein
MKWFDGLLQQFRRRSASAVVVAVAMLLASPALFSPLFADDYVHEQKWQTWLGGHEHSLWALLADYFRFVGRGHRTVLAEMETGVGAWWIAPDLKLAFFRPLSALFHVVDHAWWPGNAVLMHAHSLAWFLLLIGLLHALYRRFHTPTAAALALALFAWDDAHGMLLSWVANRSALVSASFGVAALLAHDKWIRDRWRLGTWLAPLLFAAALCSGEIGLSTLGYLVAHAMFVDRASPRQRVFRLLPFFGVAVLWQLTYSALGFGAVGSGFYFHPLHDPLGYARATLERAPVLLLSQLLPFPADVWFLLPLTAKAGLYLATFLLWMGCWKCFAHFLGGDRQLRFWVVGALSALGPVCATFPSERNLVFVGVGIAPVLARLLETCAASLVVRWQRWLVGALAIANLIVAPLALPLKCLTGLGMDRMMAPMDTAIPRDAINENRTLVAAWLDSEGWLAFTWSKRVALGIPKPSRARILALSLGKVTVTRVNANTLRISAAQGLLDSPAHHLIRGNSRPFQLGESIQLSDMTASVVELTNDRRPRVIEFRFDSALESPKWLWVRGIGTGLAPWKPPAVGNSVELDSRAPTGTRGKGNW